MSVDENLENYRRTASNIMKKIVKKKPQKKHTRVLGERNISPRVYLEEIQTDPRELQDLFQTQFCRLCPMHRTTARQTLSLTLRTRASGRVEHFSGKTRGRPPLGEKNNTPFHDLENSPYLKGLQKLF